MAQTYSLNGQLVYNKNVDCDRTIALIMVFFIQLHCSFYKIK